MNSPLEQKNPNCYHCEQPIPEHPDFFAVLNDERQPMCCLGCATIAETIANSDLENFYHYRNLSQTDIKQSLLNERQQQELEIYDEPSLQAEFTETDAEGINSSNLVIEGIQCAACIWLCQQQLKKTTDILEVNINLSTHRAEIKWQAQQVKLSQIFAALESIGYRAHPYTANKEQQLLEQEQKHATRRLGVAGLGMMQVMMIAIALYSSALQGIENHHIYFLRWASMLMTTPVVLYAAQPFFKSAWRAIKNKQANMDLPVSIAIGGAYIASIWATLTNNGEVYFDSVCMFSFFLLLGRFLEMKARHRTGQAGNAILNLLPPYAVKIVEGKETLIPAKNLEIGDKVLIQPGQTIPSDGRIFEGQSSVDESALTGEYLPLSKKIGEAVIGGSINVENPLLIEVTELSHKSEVSTIVRLLERAQADKPHIAQIADKIASYFVIGILITAIIVASSWWFISPEDSFWITLSVLVVTCPCALSLATPTALTSATGYLRQHGLLITNGHLLEHLAQANHIVFDKTGTLTEGKLELVQSQSLTNTKVEEYLAIASALEKYSEHPIAQAFTQQSNHLIAKQINNSVGQGVEGTIEEITYRIGKPRYAQAIYSEQKALAAPSNKGHWLLLSNTEQALAWFQVNDRLRPEAKDCIQQLQELNIECSMLTGDSSPAAQETAAALAIKNVISDTTPAAKLEHIQALQKQGDKLVMIGDGINDIPVLAGAQASIAMGKATDLAKTKADAVLLQGNLKQLILSIHHARKTQAIIKQNLSWAALYNLCALPLAALGLIAPYMAAVGMSLSSLVVVFNALKLNKMKQHELKSPSSFK